MTNTTEVQYFVLTAHVHLGESKYFFFAITLLWYLSICAANTFVIVVIIADRRLHEAMYVFICNHSMNEIFGCTSMYPGLLLHILSDTHEISVSACVLQVAFIHTVVASTLCSLTAMAYDRYVAICCPLRYSVIMKRGNVVVIIVSIWIYSIFCSLISISFIINMKFCGRMIDKLFCEQRLMVKLSCSVSPFDNLPDLIFAFVTIVVPFIFISLSYSKILLVSLKTGKEYKQKALTTCTPQIVSVTNIFIACFFHFLDSRLHFFKVPSYVRLFLSLYMIVFQPIITPFMYGLKLPKIRQSFREFLSNRKK